MLLSVDSARSAPTHKMSNAEQNMVCVELKFKDKTEERDVPLSSTVEELTALAAKIFGLSTQTCKLMGLVKMGQPSPSAVLSDLGIKLKTRKRKASQGDSSATSVKGFRVMVIGQPISALDTVAVMDAEFAERKAVQDQLEEEERVREQARQIALAEERMLEASRRAEAERERLARQARAQAEMQARQQAQQSLMARREMASEQDESAGVSFRLLACSSHTNVSPAQLEKLDISNKALLPPSALESCINAKVAFPLTFEISRAGVANAAEEKAGSSSSEPIAYAGVMDFTAEEGFIVLPRLMMERLGLDADATAPVYLRNVQLSPGTEVTLQPLEPEWILIDEESRKGLLEFHLRKHQFLAQGSTVVVPLNDATFRLNVLETKPSQVISITDTDLQTEVAEPLDLDGLPPQLSVGDTQELSLKSGEPFFFRFSLDDPRVSVTLKVSAQQGDPCLYITTPASDGVNSSQLARVLPSPERFTWAAQDTGSVEITLGQSDERFVTGQYYGSVYAFGDLEAKCTLTIESADNADDTSIGMSDEKHGGHLAQAASSSSASSSGSVCSNCGKSIPMSAMALHEAQCRRHTAKCTECTPARSVRKSEMQKHNLIHHTKMHCLCGIELEQELLMLHRREECPLRLVPCIYCSLRVHVTNRGPHQQECGNRKASCNTCGAVHARKEMRRHINKEHGRDQRAITWRDWH